MADVDNYPIHSDFDLKLGKLDSETDAKIARVDRKLDLVLSRLESGRRNNRPIIVSIWLIGLCLGVLILAVGIGIPAITKNNSQQSAMTDSALHDMVHSEVQDAIRKASEQSEDEEDQDP